MVDSQPDNLLISSPPGTGKTTLIRRVADNLIQRNLRAGGFYTAEIREAGHRIGFKVIALDGRESVLASVQAGAGPRVGKYSVDIESFEAVGVAALKNALVKSDIVILDEIGKMELLSATFRTSVLEALESPKPMIATLGRAPDPLIQEIKDRADVELIRLTRQNRDALVDYVTKWALKRLD